MLASSLPPRSRRLSAILSAALALTAIGSIFGLAATACSSTPAPEPPKPCDIQVVTLNIYAADNINPNENGNPRPVVVRLYQLKGDVRLLNASYDDVLLKDKEVLADDVVKVDEVGVYPNDLVEIKFERNKEAAFLAGVALFHSPKGQSWKTFYEFPLPPGEQSCAGRAGDGGPPEADPRATFFIESTKIDNGSQFDESMFTTSAPVRRINLPKSSGGTSDGSQPGGQQGGQPGGGAPPPSPGLPAGPPTP
jgi:type VI secretion system protein VasD